MDRDFSIGERKFKLLKIDAFKQFHIVRRFAPVLKEMLPVLTTLGRDLRAAESLSEDAKLEQFAKLAAPFMDGLSKLSDADADKVLFGLLSHVEMQETHGNWSRLATDSQLRFADLELPVILNAAGRAFMFNLSGFFAALPRAS
jgi:hypothetical protein